LDADGWTLKIESPTSEKIAIKMKRSHRRHADVSPVPQAVPDGFQIRRATPRDADIIAWHRARMFQDMGDVSGDAFEILRAKAGTQLKQWIDNGDYLGWLAAPVDEPEMIVAGAGVQLQAILPRPLDVSTIGEGRQGIIVNVFTERHWRKRGIARLLIEEIIHWSKNEHLNRLVLHAADEGRSIYGKLGFVASNEMRFARDW
jgi:GNAT superfamily N-acetyltransferase